MNDCIFCKIVSGEIPANHIYENDKTIAFLDLHPLRKGHTLVIPREHYADIYEAPDDVLAAMIRGAKALAPAIRSAAEAEGIRITMNNGAAAGQIIFHAHIHIIPYPVDEVSGKREDYAEGEHHQYVEKIQAFLEK